MAHLPVDHHLRPLYRALAGLSGAFSLGLGVIGFSRTSGLPFFEQSDLPTVFGVTMNPGFAVTSIVLGAVVLVATVVGRNLDRSVNLGVGSIFLVIGTGMLAFMRTDANILGFTMTNVIVTYIVGMVLLTAGLYGKVTPAGTRHSEPVRERVTAE